MLQPSRLFFWLGEHNGLHQGTNFLAPQKVSRNKSTLGKIFTLLSMQLPGRNCYLSQHRQLNPAVTDQHHHEPCSTRLEFIHLYKPSPTLLLHKSLQTCTRLYTLLHTLFKRRFCESNLIYCKHQLSIIYNHTHVCYPLLPSHTSLHFGLTCHSFSQHARFMQVEQLHIPIHDGAYRQGTRNSRCRFTFPNL